MNTVISIGDLRVNLAHYLNFVSRGNIVAIKDHKKKQIVAELIGAQRTNYRSYKAMLNRVAGTFTAARHPEWASHQKTTMWLQRSRRADERSF